MDFARHSVSRREGRAGIVRPNLASPSSIVVHELAFGRHGTYILGSHDISPDAMTSGSKEVGLW